MELIRSHDALFRFVFGDLEQAADLLRAILPRPGSARRPCWSVPVCMPPTQWCCGAGVSAS
jgi:hypothetical protein